jgi:hypothetical protein
VTQAYQKIRRSPCSGFNNVPRPVFNSLVDSATPSAVIFHIFGQRHPETYQNGAALIQNKWVPPPRRALTEVCAPSDGSAIRRSQGSATGSSTIDQPPIPILPANAADRMLDHLPLAAPPEPDSPGSG